MQGEKLLPMALAVECVTGQRPHPVTCWRWATKGIKGIKLETKKLGGQRLTSLAAVQRFLDATTEASESKPAFKPTVEVAPSSRALKAKLQLQQLVKPRAKGE